MLCAIKGYRIILTMPETMSLERRLLLKAYGAELVLTDGKLGMQGAVNKALELHKQNNNSFIPSQFDNSSNPQAHYLTTANEIWENTDGKVDIIVAGVGTGGTISGTAKRLKELNPNIKAVAVEPYSSQLLGGKAAGPHKIQGIGANFIPENYAPEVIDEIIPVKTKMLLRQLETYHKKKGFLQDFPAVQIFGQQ